MLNVAAAERSKKSAGAFCTAVKQEQPASEVLALAGSNRVKTGISHDNDSMRIAFGKHCHCQIQLVDGRVGEKDVSCIHQTGR